MAVTASGRGTSSGTNDIHKDEALLTAFLNLSYQDGLTALAGGAQAGTSVSKYQVTRFTTVASANDSAQLGVTLPGHFRVVINAAAANALAVFPQTGDAINALSANASFSVGAGKTAVFFCTVSGVWNSLLSA